MAGAGPATALAIFLFFGAVLFLPGSAAAATVEIAASPGLAQVEPGQSVTFTLMLENKATVSDVISLDVSGLPKNWSALFGDETLQLGPGETGTTTLTVRPEKTAMAGDTDLNVSAESTLAAGGKAYVNAKVRVKQVHKLDLLVTQPAAVTAGGSTSIPITIKNTGNGPDSVTISVIPNGAATSWATVSSVTYDLEPGEPQAYTHVLNVPKDTPADKYQFIVRARSSEAGVEETRTADLEVQRKGVAGFNLDAMSILIILVVVFAVVVIVAALFTPKKNKGPAKSEQQAATGPAKKVKRKKVAPAVTKKHLDEHKKHLERIERRIDELHDKVEGMSKGHSDLMGHYEAHLTKHHGVKAEARPIPPPLPPPPTPMEISEVHPPEVKQESVGTQAEALHPEGPPENMSLGDEKGQVRERRCPKCKGKVQKDWIKCPACSTLL